MSSYGGPNIVTNGLILCLDAANTLSYVSGSTSWFDLSGRGNTGTLINGPTFSSANGGSIVFDGTDDYVTIPVNIGSPNFNYTIGITFNVTSFTTTDMRLIGSYSGADSQLTVGWDTQTLKLWLQSSWNETNFVSSVNTTYILSIVHQGTDTFIYVNGSLNSTISSKTSYFTNLGIANPFILLYGSYFKGSVYSTQVYNRALSAAEVQQNYDATKTRFGL